MAHEFEYDSYSEAERIAILENRAAELERMLLAALPANARPEQRRPPAMPYEVDAYPGADAIGIPPDTGMPDTGAPDTGAPDTGAPGADPDEEPDGAPYIDWPDGSSQGYGQGRTEALLNRGRVRARPSRARRILGHWRLLALGAVAATAGVIAAFLALGGGTAAWPASVATVQAEVKQACANPDVAAEPSGLNFACDKGTQQVLWVFSLLTSGDNPGFVDSSTGRRGLEPIQPAQGGDIAWSLNLHHPYNAANPVDSLQVAARAINNIIGGATLTSKTGGAMVEPGLESKAANCQRYTGSARLASRAGYPASCAAPLTSAGAAALVSDAFQQWMGGTPSQIAQQAGVLFQNADNPGDPRVQAILASLPAAEG